MNSIGHGLRGLTRFSGRDTNSQFWPYALCVLVLTMIVATIGFAATMSDTLARMQQFAAEHPDQAPVTTGPGSYSIHIEGPMTPELAFDLTPMAVSMAVAVGIAVVLLAAAVARRLHDRGRSGLWGLAPLPFLAIGLTLFPGLFASAANGQAPSEALMLGLSFNNMVYIATLLFLVVLLLKSSDAGTNRYGSPVV